MNPSSFDGQEVVHVDRLSKADLMSVHSFPSLLRHLRTIVKDRLRLKSDPTIEFDKITIPTPLQQRALDRLGVSLTV